MSGKFLLSVSDAEHKQGRTTTVFAQISSKAAISAATSTAARQANHQYAEPNLLKCHIHRMHS